MNGIEELERIEASEPVEASVVIKSIMKDFGIDMDSPDAMLSRSWPLVAPEYANFSKCTGIKDGKLYVCVTHPSKATLIKMNSKELVKRIRSAFPESSVNALCIYMT